MSRNPYLAASRPTSSFTRSSRSSKRNDLSSSKSSLVGRSRSSANLGGYMSSSTYTPTSSYTPMSSTWQRPLSSSRVSSRHATDPSTNLSSSSSNRANDYTPSSQLRSSEPSEESRRSSLYKSASTHDLNSMDRRNDHDDDNDDTTSNVLNHAPIFQTLSE